MTMGDRRAPPQRLSDPIDQVLGPTGLLSQQLSHYEPRPAQLTMARQVMEALENGDKLIVEAGTGTGKTLAYLVPAVLSGIKTVISTGTKTLQDQVYERELPRLLDLVGKDRRSTCCMKGIGNFLCLRRLNEVRRAPSLFADPLLEPLLRWAETTETGDRAELSALPDGHPLWNEVSPTPETRIGPRCSFFESCFVTRMRRQAAAADVIVVNHHLLLADLVLRQTAPGAGVIPAFEALIIDEAHQLEAIATASFGQMVSGQSLGTLARDGSRAASVCRDEALERLAHRLAESGADLFHSVARELLSGARLEAAREDLADAGPSAARLRLTEPPLDGQLRQPYFNVDASLEALEEHLSLRAGEEELGQLALRAQRAREALALFAEPPSRGFIFWAERVRGGGLALHASPVEVGPLLQSSVLGEPLPVVLTSATLSTGRCFARPGRPGEERDSVDLPFCERSDRRATAAASSPSRSLAYYRQRIGLESAPEVQELILPSPFRYETQVLLYLPRDLPQPSQPEFVMRAAERMTQLIDITGGRALVLFTSHRNLQAARRSSHRSSTTPCSVRETSPARCSWIAFVARSRACSWRRRVSGKESTSSASRSRWSSWTSCLSRCPAIR